MILWLKCIFFFIQLNTKWQSGFIKNIFLLNMDPNKEEKEQNDQNQLTQTYRCPCTDTVCYHPEHEKPSGLLVFFLSVMLLFKVRSHRISHLTICWNNRYTLLQLRCRFFYKLINIFSELTLGQWCVMVTVTSKPLLYCATQLVMFVWDAYVMSHFPTEQQLGHLPHSRECQQSKHVSCECILASRHYRQLNNTKQCFIKLKIVSFFMNVQTIILRADLCDMSIRDVVLCATQILCCIQIDRQIKARWGCILPATPLAETTHPERWQQMGPKHWSGISLYDSNPVCCRRDTGHSNAGSNHVSNAPCTQLLLNTSVERTALTLTVTIIECVV